MRSFRCLFVITWLILVASSTQVSAQPFSFPVCLGDASSWHIMESDPNRSDYTPPIIRTITIDRDTVVNGEVYFFSIFPEELRLPSFWVRSDPQGLYCLTDLGDSLLLPSTASIGTSVLGGSISDTLTVSTAYGKSRAYKIKRVDSLRTLQWTIADGVGIWDFITYERYKSNYVYCNFLSGRRCGLGPASDPIPIDVPLRTGDILVHGPDRCQIQSSRQSSRGPYWVGLPSPPILRRRNQSMSLRITSTCVVRIEPVGPGEWLEYYPAFIPATDSVSIGERYWHVAARFDTTVFNENVKAFTLVTNDGDKQRTMIIADRFGVLYEEVPGYRFAALESAVISGVKYNRNTQRRRLFPLCDSSVYEYVAEGDRWRDTARVDLRRDTLINGIEYRYFSLPGIPIDGSPMYQKSDLVGWFRETPEGVVRTDSTLAFPSTADIGDATAVGVIVDIFEKEINGMIRYVFAGADIGYHYNHVDTLVEGIGLIRSRSYTFPSGLFDWRLSGALTCGESWGIPLGVAAASARPDEAEVQLYPNPAPAGTHVVHVRFTGIEARDLRISVHDLLGREVRNEQLKNSIIENHPVLNVAGMPAGMYFVLIRNGRNAFSKPLLILR